MAGFNWDQLILDNPTMSQSAIVGTKEKFPAGNRPQRQKRGEDKRTVLHVQYSFRVLSHAIRPALVFTKD